MAPAPSRLAVVAPAGLLVCVMLVRFARRMAGGSVVLVSVEVWRAAAKALLNSIGKLPEEIRSPLTSTLCLSIPLSVIGAVAGTGWKLYGVLQSRLTYAIERNCKVSLTFCNSDKHYDAVVDYIGTRCAVETGKITASTSPRSRPSFQEMLAGWLGGKVKAPTLYYQPDLQAFSDSFTWRDDDGQSHKIWINRVVEKPQMRTDSGKAKKDPESITLTLWWTTDAQTLKNFMSAALHAMLRDDSEGKVEIYVKHMWLPMWTKAISKDKRDRDTIVLDENLADYVVNDARHFFKKETADWYHNAGIPYRRGYLLFGPPGCGKTSFAQVLAGELGIDVCLMNLSNQDMNDDDLAELLRAAPVRSMLLLEDVDAIFVERRSAQEKRGGGISFSGLLNALDGAAAQEGCIIVLTTNHKDRLDEALIRPGRCDVHVHIQKSSQDQAKRMYERFFAKQAKIKSSVASRITTTTAHSFKTGDAVLYKLESEDSALQLGGLPAKERKTYFAHVPGGQGLLSMNQNSLLLYDTAENAAVGGPEGLLPASGGKGSKLCVHPPSSARFSSRIPGNQISMAKLQGYLMKQKLDAEQHFKRLREKGEGLRELYSEDLSEEEQRQLFDEAVADFAAESAVMNVHELLDVKPDVHEPDLTIYDHLKRLGLQRAAPFFEHFGVRSKKDISKDLKEHMQHWDPLLKFGYQHKRLAKLFEDESSLKDDYALADLSILRDRFISSFQKVPAEAPPALPEAGPPPPPPALVRASTEPPRNSDVVLKRPRIELLRQTSVTSGSEEQLGLLDMAHQFQEALEANGKTNVSIWQLNMHFDRFADDARGALNNCDCLRKCDADRQPEERVMKPMTTFGFLCRIGLEKYSFKLEEEGYRLWVDFKDLSKDDLKAAGDMSKEDAALCHAVLQGSKERPDLVRMCEMPEFADLQDSFISRFPGASSKQAQKFAIMLTDATGVTHVSCFQVKSFLEEAKSPVEALSTVTQGLPLPVVAEAARKPPEPPPPPPAAPKSWIEEWFEGADLERYSQIFMDQSLSLRDDLLDAPLDHKTLEGWGINKMGVRCKILRMIEAEKVK
eukprot:TRINITY_DN68659_c0_g1_i1.p1 TRINITY_DN68659_c0_g1~~TRINITY_DN68659_c0_g1_i1.p1  ORF type:complete len:1096 (-),score=214.05 TRINITY_DN68659_c0_g1_i1:241-3453(-)